MKKVTRKKAEQLAKNYPDALEVRDVAAILKCVNKTVLRIIAIGELPYTMIGRKYYIACSLRHYRHDTASRGRNGKLYRKIKIVD